jgi:hypothetical protein
MCGRNEEWFPNVGSMLENHNGQHLLKGYGYMLSMIKNKHYRN